MGLFNREHRQLHYQLFVHSDPSEKTPLVIYLHGLMMDNLSSGYFTFAHQLSAEAHVLLYDLIGHGRSSFESEGYLITDHLADLSALIEHVKIELDDVHLPIILIGCSFGGMLALRAAEELSEVTSVVLLEGHIGSPSFIEQLTADLSASGEEAKTLVMTHFQHWLHRGSERKRARLEKRSRALFHQSTLVQDLRDSHLEGPVKVELETPILYLYGGQSDAYDRARKLYESRLHRGALGDVFMPFNECSHALLWEATEAVTDELSRWIIDH